MTTDRSPCGTAADGKPAVEGDPLADIDVVVNRVRWVMKGGDVVVDKAGAPSRSGF